MIREGETINGNPLKKAKSTTVTSNTAISVSHEELCAFIYACQHFTECVPNRFDLAAKFVQAQNIEYRHNAVVTLGVSNHGRSRELSLTEKKDCSTLHSLIAKSYPSLLETDFTACLFELKGKSALKPLVFLPYTTSCCGKTIKMDNRPSFPLVYTMEGTLVGAAFHGQCSICSTKYYPNYKASGGDRYYTEPSAAAYFHVTSLTVFETILVCDIVNNIWVSGTTFESRAKVYNLTFSSKDEARLPQLKQFDRSGDWKLNEQRITDAFFLWVVLEYYQRKGVLSQTPIQHVYGKTQHRWDTETMCEKLWNDICLEKNKWIQHSCKTPGCAEGYITVDGNEYLKRSKCALPISQVKARKDLPTVKIGCSNSPVSGGKHKAASKFCPDHQKSSGNTYDIPLPRQFSKFEQEQEKNLLPDDEPLITAALETGCRKKKDKTLFFETTAGMLAFIRPCGIVVSMTEMFTHESATQVFLFLLRTFCTDMNDLKRLRYLGYDRGCSFVPYLQNQAKNGSAGAKVLLENVEFLVDIFHVKKHTEAVCMPLDNPECLYHPHLPKFSEIKNANTESCEQGFRRLNEYFHLTRKMTVHRRNVLFWFVNERFNENRECTLRGKGLM